jgi:hypothetical protein
MSEVVIKAPGKSRRQQGWHVVSERKRDGAVVVSPPYKTREHAIENAVGREMAGHTVRSVSGPNGECVELDDIKRRRQVRLAEVRGEAERDDQTDN